MVDKRRGRVESMLPNGIGEEGWSQCSLMVDKKRGSVGVKVDS